MSSNTQLQTKMKITANNQKEDQDIEEPFHLFKIFIKGIIVITLLICFLIGVKTLSTGVKMFGGDFARSLFDLTHMPFVSLMAGMLSTVLFQSSSVTTSMIVGLVSSGQITVTGAIPMIMGANLGTSVTNTLVSLSYVKEAATFKRAFAAATVHDFFNLLSVFILLPFELLTGFIGKAATTFTSFLYGSTSGIAYSSPIKGLIKPPVSFLKHQTLSFFGKEMAAASMVVLAAVIILLSLALIVRTMKAVIENNKGDVIDKLLSKRGYVSILLGALLTISVQSSSITTSLLIPMAGTGILSLQAIYPITLGANIGTTATAILAAFAGNQAGLTIALVHLIFNLLGTLIFFPHPIMRQIPINCAIKLSSLIQKSKSIGFAYVAFVFFFFPLGIVLLKNT